MQGIEQAIMFEKLADNQAFLSAVEKVESKVELQRLFEKYGLELSCDEIDSFINMVDALSKDSLDADALDAVSGGVNPMEFFKKAWSCAKAVAKPSWNLGRKLANWENSLRRN